MKNDDRCPACGRRKPGPAGDAKRDERIVRLHDQGKSNAEIAGFVGLSKARVSAIIRQAYKVWEARTW